MHVPARFRYPRRHSLTPPRAIQPHQCNASSVLTPGTHLFAANCATWRAGRTRTSRLGTDIAFATGSLARFRAASIGKRPNISYATSQGTKQWCLGGRVPGGRGLHQLMDADWSSYRGDRRSIGAYVVKIGDGAVSW